jgi:hypothetical protein
MAEQRVTLAEAFADVLAVARGSQDPHAGDIAERYIAEQTGDQDQDGDGYDELSVAELKDEVNRRNDDRQQGEPLVVVKGKGNKDDIIAALREDDENRKE